VYRPSHFVSDVPHGKAACRPEMRLALEDLHSTPSWVAPAILLIRAAFVTSDRTVSRDLVTALG
jgi:hypothetical protein